ncbi:TRAF3-interacting JNK-activating modulator isoform X2 [Synchiropus splendidus]|uniref:TRAF3-interacting JNK-activating modulator isoform X2 n=1 Tax=Synchiropus splendidus TaxID=270530 RepID=UPI00237D8F67|nr:TRAF3-interacting JNK-activating modulator isoform X2 [Synchiropus splendidus]
MERVFSYQAWFPLEREFDRAVASRAEKREELRGRNNVTSCRSPPRERTGLIKTELRKKRQQEFLRRRSFSPERQTSRGSDEVFQVMPHSSSRSSGTSQMEESSPPDRSKWASLWFDQEVQQVQTSTSYSITQTTRMASVASTNVASESENNLLRMRDSSVQTDGFITIQESHVQQLAEYLKEALWREEAVKQKLVRLQKSTSNLIQSSDEVWTTHCSEHQLRNKVNALEGQLQACLQKFPKDGVKKLVLQMEKQKLLYEQKATMAVQKATEEKMEALSQAETLQEALVSSKAESVRWQGLYEEQRENSTQLRRHQQLGEQQLQQLHGQMELSRSTEAELTEEVVSLREKREELQLNVSQLEEHNQALEDQVQFMRENVKLQESLMEGFEDLEGEVSVKETRQSQLQEQLLYTLEKLRLKEKEVEELQSELRVLEQEYQSSQTRLSQCREELRQMRQRRSRALVCATWWKVYGLLFLLQAIAAAIMLWLWHPPFREQVEDLYWDIEARVEDYLMQMASPQQSGCFRPV